MTLDELKARRDELAAQRDQLLTTFHLTRGYLQRIEEEIAEAEAEAEEEGVPAPTDCP